MKSFYFIREFGSLMDGKKAARTAGVVLSIFAFIVLIYFLLLPKDQPLNVSTGLEEFPQNHNTLAQIQTGLSSSEINDLYLSLRRLQSVDNLILVLSEEVNQGHLKVPSELSQEADFFLIKTSDQDQLLQELKNQPRIRMVTTLSGQIRRQGSEPHSLWMKILILVIGVLLAGLSFYLLRSLIDRILDSWEGELQIVKYSGLPRFSVKFPLALGGTGLGLLGSILSVLLLLALSTWADGIRILQQLPRLLDNTSLLVITIWSLLLGVVLGFLASLSSLRAVDHFWTSSRDN